MQGIWPVYRELSFKLNSSWKYDSICWLLITWKCLQHIKLHTTILKNAKHYIILGWPRGLQFLVCCWYGMEHYICQLSATAVLSVQTVRLNLPTTHTTQLYLPLTHTRHTLVEPCHQPVVNKSWSWGRKKGTDWLQGYTHNSLRGQGHDRRINCNNSQSMLGPVGSILMSFTITNNVFK